MWSQGRRSRVTSLLPLLAQTPPLELFIESPPLARTMDVRKERLWDAGQGCSTSCFQKVRPWACRGSHFFLSWPLGLFPGASFSERSYPLWFPGDVGPHVMTWLAVRLGSKGARLSPPPKEMCVSLFCPEEGKWLLKSVLKWLWISLWCS